MARIEFDIPDKLYREALEVAAEMGLELHDLVQNAFEGYMSGVRTARRDDLDSASPATVVQLPTVDDELDAQDLHGTEEWLTTE